MKLSSFLRSWGRCWVGKAVAPPPLSVGIAAEDSKKEGSDRVDRHLKSWKEKNLGVELFQARNFYFDRELIGASGKHV